MQAQIAAIRRADAASAAILIAAAGAASLLGAWYFQYVVGLAPCPLCLEQRVAYYVAIPLAVLLWLGAGYGASRKVLAAGFAVIAIAMIWNAGLGVYHSGIEWKWWPGPAECSGSLGNLGGQGGLLNQLQSVSVVRCDEAPWRFLGLSLAGYNVLLSLAIAAAALWGLRGVWQRGR
ncbi:MAG: disulfide bond formation protein B [Pseudolabrys sp.]